MSRHCENAGIALEHHHKHIGGGVVVLVDLVACDGYAWCWAFVKLMFYDLSCNNHPPTATIATSTTIATNNKATDCQISLFYANVTMAAVVIVLVIVVAGCHFLWRLLMFFNVVTRFSCCCCCCCCCHHCKFVFMSYALMLPWKKVFHQILILLRYCCCCCSFF